MVRFNKYLYRSFFVSYALWLMLMSFYFVTDFDLLIDILEKHISPDGEITSKYIAFWKICLCPLYFFVIFVLTFNLAKFSPAKLSIYLLIYFVIFFSHLFIYLNANNFFNQTIKEDGFWEWATVCVSIFSAILFFLAGAFGVRCAFFLGFFWLIFAMEEISWGQRLFEIESTEFVKKYNYQSELNFHNFLNPFINYLYLIFFLTTALIFTSFRNMRLFSLFYRLKSVSFVMQVSDKYNTPVLLILCTLASPAYFNLAEFLEQQLALIGLILSLTILREIKLKK